MATENAPYTFSRVPGFDTYTGDRRVWSNQTRHKFVVFVIDMEKFIGQGYMAGTLGEAKFAADYFAKHYKFPASGEYKQPE